MKASKESKEERHSSVDPSAAKATGGTPTFQFENTKLQASFSELADAASPTSQQTAQRKALDEMMSNSEHNKQIAQLQDMLGSSASVVDSATPNQATKTGLPSQLKAGIEHLSGQAMDDVSVYRNSNKPAQLQAHAYAQGTDIHLGPGQDKHLPHEAWHVAQQKQGRVQPTIQRMGKIDINDDQHLEQEADEMGAQAASYSTPSEPNTLSHTPIQQSTNTQFKKQDIVQRLVYDNYRDKNELSVEDAVASIWPEFQSDPITKRQLTSVVSEFISTSKTTDLDALKQIVRLRLSGTSEKALVKDSAALDTVTETDLLSGKVRYLKPAGNTNVVAIFGHGSPIGNTPPLDGVKIGYYAEHGEAALQPLNAGIKSAPYPENMSADAIHNYKLTKHAVIDNLQQYQSIVDMVKSNRLPYVLIKQETTTAELIPALKALGYSEIRAIHCRGEQDQFETNFIDETLELDINLFNTEEEEDRQWFNPIFDTDYTVNMYVCTSDTKYSPGYFKITGITDSKITVQSVSKDEFNASAYS